MKLRSQRSGGRCRRGAPAITGGVHVTLGVRQETLHLGASILEHPAVLFPCCLLDGRQ